VKWILGRAQKNDRAYAVEAANTHVAALARSDVAFGKAMGTFDLICPDGMPLIWALNSKLRADEKLTDRVYGPTLMLETLKATNGKAEFKHFLLGGKQSTLDKLKQNFATQFPGVMIAATHSPPFGEWPENELEIILEKIKSSGANLIWVEARTLDRKSQTSTATGRLFRYRCRIRIPCRRGQTISTHPPAPRNGVGIPRGDGAPPALQTLFHLQYTFYLSSSPRENERLNYH